MQKIVTLAASFVLLFGLLVCFVGCGQGTKAKPEGGTFWEAVQNEDWALVRRWVEYDRTLVNSRGNFTDYQAYNHARSVLAGDPRQSQLSPPITPGMTPLFLVTIRGNLEMVKFLCENGADLNATVDYKMAMTPLHVAVTLARDKSHEHVGIVEYLIKAGANVNARTGGNGSTPLDYCKPVLWEGDATVLKVERMLIDAGGRKFLQKR